MAARMVSTSVLRPGYHVRVRQRRYRGLHAAHAPHGHSPGQDVGRCAQEWLSVEIAGYTGPHATAPPRQVMNKLFGEEVVKEALVEFTLKRAHVSPTSVHPHVSPFG